VILINNADCLHLGNIISYVFDNFKPKTYLTFAAYKGMALPDGIFDNLDWNNLDNVLGLIDHTDKDSWHFNTALFPQTESLSFIPYSAAISREDMELLSGYDERFNKGVGFEDSDLCVRIKNLGLKMIAVSNPFCVHQKHPPTVYNDEINPGFFYYLQDKFPNRIKAPENKIYNI
jgi:GT2 family glycosyltransferase